MSTVLDCECFSKEHGFSYIHAVSHGGNTSVSHIDKDLFSVFLLLEGSLDYVIEGKVVHVTPKDIILVGNNEFHYSIVKNGASCDYILLMIDLEFFIKNNCAGFDDMVFNRKIGSDNVIDAKKVLRSGIFDIFERLDSYVKEQPVCLTVINGIIIELLYNLNRQVKKANNSNHKHEKIKNILSYINNNLNEELSLDNIASKFFLTKQHLCKIFKENTGFTVNKYITYKRVVLVRELYLKGMSLSQACSEAGFSDYSAFYRAYSKIMHEPPRKSLSKIKL